MNVSYCSRILKYLMIIAPRQSFVAKEVDFLMTSLDHILEAECLVPACFQGLKKGCHIVNMRNLLESSRWRFVHPWQTEGPGDQISECNQSNNFQDLYDLGLLNNYQILFIPSQALF